jgi:hypothetical protein
MEPSQIYIAVAIIALALIALALFFISRKKESYKLTPLAGTAFGFVIAGIIFGENRLIGYSLIGMGVTLAIIDAFLKYRASKKN